MLDWPTKDRARGVVHDERYTELLADFCDFRNWKNGELRVRQRLAVVASRFRIRRTPEILGICGVNKPALDAHRAQRILEQIPGAAVDIGRTDEVITGMTDVLDRKQRRRLPGGERQCGDAFFQHRLSRIHDARVYVPEFLEREQVARMLRRIELVGRRLIDRHGYRMGGRIGAIASGVQYDGLCVMAFGRHNFSAWFDI